MLTQWSVLQKFLEETGLVPKKGFSQNFLIDGNIVRLLLASAQVERGECVLEIGPGPGGVTQALLAAGARVIAVEKDARFAQVLPRLGGDLTVYTQDFLTFPLDLPPFKVIASLPYHLTTEILQRLISHPQLRGLSVLIQKEAAERILASPGTRDYNAFTVVLKGYGEGSYVKTVSRRCFYPQPRVDSAIFHFVPRSEIPPLLFGEVVQRAFAQRRKMLRHVFEERLLKEAGISPTARPEEIEWPAFVRLAQLC